MYNCILCIYPPPPVAFTQPRTGKEVCMLKLTYNREKDGPKRCILKKLKIFNSQTFLLLSKYLIISRGPVSIGRLTQDFRLSIFSWGPFRIFTKISGDIRNFVHVDDTVDKLFTSVNDTRNILSPVSLSPAINYHRCR